MHLDYRRDGRVVECGGLENRCPLYSGPGVRIPLPPQIKKGSVRSFFIFKIAAESYSDAYLENKNNTNAVSAFLILAPPLGSRARLEIGQVIPPLCTIHFTFKINCKVLFWCIMLKYGIRFNTIPGNYFLCGNIIE